MTEQAKKRPELVIFLERYQDKIAASWAEKIITELASGKLRVSSSEINASTRQGIANLINFLNTDLVEGIDGFFNESIGDALGRMAPRGLGRMPVISHEDPYELLGLIRREDIITAYDLALTRRASIHHQTQRAQLQTKETMDFVEIHLSGDDPVVGKTVSEISAALPTGSVLVSIARGSRVIISHGNNEFQAGDQVTAFTRQKDAQALFRCLHGNRSEKEPLFSQDGQKRTDDK